MHQVGRHSRRIELATLEFDRLDEAVRLFGQWVTTSRGVVAAHDLRRRGIEEDDGHLVSTRTQLADLVEQLLVAATGDESQPRDVARTASPRDRRSC